ASNIRNGAIRKKIAFFTHGCKLNYTETSTISRKIKHEGYSIVDFNTPADYYIINTCMVTEKAERKCRQTIKKAYKQNPEAKIIVIGCYSELKANELKEIPGVFLTFGNSDKFNIVNVISEKNDPKPDNANEFHSSYSAGDRTRSFLKIQDGCNYFCSYCTIPYVRGRSRNAPIAQLIETAKTIKAQGVKEIILTGINIGDYGKSSNENLHKLLMELANIDDIYFRISSIEPNLLTHEIIDLVKNNKQFSPHFHIPLQAGTDKILKRMNRKYSISFFRDKVSEIKKAIPDCFIGTDLIVGFPGETEDDYTETYNYLNQLELSDIHVFSFSSREMAKAYTMEPKVKGEIIKKRSDGIQLLAQKKHLSFIQSQLNKTKLCLFEKSAKNKYIYGLTDNYIKVVTNYKEGLENTHQMVQLTSIENNNEVFCKII
ncbi:MAG: tRNA (N(6)-L-threonylcarbamoyladenosine(37)-C(2))-methylthiotransferase MtaB, partial [Marinilabiliales bacterium]